MSASARTSSRVSVVVPTYNGLSFLPETLGRIFAQTFADFELIVVDDGSTDGTADYLAGLADPRLRVIRQTNGGVGAARNRGIDEARADLVAFCDHDDVWVDDKLAVQVAFMDTHADCVGCVVPWADSRAADVAVYRQAGEIVDRPLRVLARGGLFLITSALMARRTALDGLRYFTIPKCFEDTPLQLRLLARGPFGVAGDRVRMTYRWHGGNYSASADYFHNGWRLLRRLQAEGYFADVADRVGLERFICHIARTTAVTLLKSGRPHDARQVYRTELGRQLRDGAVKFVAGFPAMALAARRERVEKTKV